MTENKKRKDDFTPKYYNAQAIIDNTELQPAEQVCELVKHYSMCLFGIATDISDYYGKLKELENEVEQLKQQNFRLSVSNRSLRLQLKAHDVEPQAIVDELAKLKDENLRLKGALTKCKKQVAEMQDETTITELKAQGDRYRQNALYYKNQVQELKAKIQALTERKDNGK